MNKAFEKIVERLEIYEYNNLIEHNEELSEHCKKTDCDSVVNCSVCIMDKAISIVQEIAEEYDNGWVPCSERLPEEYGDYLVWWTDITRGQYYEIVEYEPNNGWIGEIPQAVEGIYSVIAWQPLPEPFKERD